MNLPRWFGRVFDRHTQKRLDAIARRDREEREHFLSRQAAIREMSPSTIPKPPAPPIEPVVPYKPMMVVDLMNDLEREVNINERIKKQLQNPIDQPRPFPINGPAVTASSWAMGYTGRIP